MHHMHFNELAATRTLLLKSEGASDNLNGRVVAVPPQAGDSHRLSS